MSDETSSAPTQSDPGSPPPVKAPSDRVAPAGDGAYVVQRGDTLSSIATAHGFFLETLWNDPANAALKATRDDPEVLLPGDRVAIPEKAPPKLACETTRRHTFRRRGVPVRVAFRLVGPGGQVFANKRYRLVIGKTTHTGTTNGDGALEHWAMPDVREGTLTLYQDEEGDSAPLEWRLSIGTLDPVGAVRGARSRLNNLGYDCGDEGDTGAFAASVTRFQADHGLDATGDLDDATLAALRDAFGV